MLLRQGHCVPSAGLEAQVRVSADQSQVFCNVAIPEPMLGRLCLLLTAQIARMHSK